MKASATLIFRSRLLVASALMLCAAQTRAQSVPVRLIVAKGRPLEVVLPERVSITRVGQSIAGTLVEPVYAYDRIVVPEGTGIEGHVAALGSLSRLQRTRAALSGDLTPARPVELQFDRLILASGEVVPIQTIVKTVIPHIRKFSAPEAPRTDAPQDSHRGGTVREAKDKARRAVQSAEQRGRDVLAEVTQPGKGARLKDAVVQRLPYHPQIIAAGTGYEVELVAPLDFGEVLAAERSPGQRPAPSSSLRVRLITTLDSSKTPRGTPLEAVVTEPVFSDDHQLIFPEGTALEGEVTLAKAPRRMHRNGQLRFLFERVRPDNSEPSPLLAQLESAHASRDDALTIDDEGGTTLGNSKTRFIAPALAIFALRANLRHDGDHLDPDGDGHIIHSNNPGALGVGGFLGLGVLGAGLSQLSRPLGLGLSAFGAARTLYANVLGKGRDVRFPADSLLQLQLAPGPPSP